MAGKLLLIRLYFNGKWRELNSGKIFIEKILEKKNRNCDYRHLLLSITLILLFLEHSLFAPWEPGHGWLRGPKKLF